jgi:hypothetical protein
VNPSRNTKTGKTLAAIVLLFTAVHTFATDLHFGEVGSPVTCKTFKVKGRVPTSVDVMTTAVAACQPRGKTLKCSLSVSGQESEPFVGHPAKGSVIARRRDGAVLKLIACNDSGCDMVEVTFGRNGILCANGPLRAVNP